MKASLHFKSSPSLLAHGQTCSLFCPLPLTVPGQPGKFKVGRVTDTSIELTWEPAYTKEGIVNYELLYKPVRFGGLVRTSHSLLIRLSAGQPLYKTETG